MANYPPGSEYPVDTSFSRSPHMARTQQLAPSRQTSRQFDAYGAANTPSSLYNPADSMARYDTRRMMDNRFMPAFGSTAMNGGPLYDPGSGAQTWNAAAANAFAGAPPNMAAATLGPIGTQTARLRSSRPRGGLPGPWLDQAPMPQQPFSNPEQTRLSQPGRQDSVAEEDELIPTAIVIKNIPFAVKKESLIQLMTDMSLPLPYAFNYHFDNGVFRGLAFANFTSAEETAAVIAHLNHLELQGRKLRVEYKKMLPAHERERIEQDKRWRRGQLEEQHRSLPNPQLQTQPSVSSLASHQLAGSSPSPVSQHGSKPNYDLNDQQTLAFYTKLAIFKNDPNQETLVMSPTLSPEHRRTIHALAHNLNLHHTSHGTGDQRQVHIMKYPSGTKVSPPHQPFAPNPLANDGTRTKALNRAATTDFGEARQQDSSAFSGLRGQSSVGLLGVLETSNGYSSAANLRSAKSFTDLRSYTPSPVPSTSSFPSGQQPVSVRGVPPVDGSLPSGTPTATSATSNFGDDSQLMSGLGNLSLGTGIGNPGSPRRVRNMFSWEGQTPNPATAPIGSNRTLSTGFDSGSQDRLSTRPSRGTGAERPSGFRRQNGPPGRGGDEMRGNPEIIVE